MYVTGTHVHLLHGSTNPAMQIHVESAPFVCNPSRVFMGLKQRESKAACILYSQPSSLKKATTIHILAKKHYEW